MTQTLVLPTAPQTLRQPVSPIQYACRIAENCLLCSGPLQHQLSGRERIDIDGIAAEKPYYAARLAGATPQQVAVALAVDDGYRLDGLQEVTLSHDKGISRWKLVEEFDDKAEGFEAYINALPPIDRAKVLFLLFKTGGRKVERTLDSIFIRVCRTARELLRQTESPVQECHWLSRSVIYMEAQLPRRDYTKVHGILTGPGPMRIALADVMEMPQDRAGGHASHSMMLQFKGELPDDIADWQLSLLLKDQIVPVQPIQGGQDAGLGSLVAHLTRLSERNRYALRDFIVRSLIDQAAGNTQAAAADIVRTLQYYLPAEQTSICDPKSPFGMNVEIAIPLPNKGLFVSGWIYDPENMLQRATLLSDLGFSLPFSAGSERLPRPDVRELYKDSPFASEKNGWGFAHFIEYPDDVKKKLRNWPSPYSFRLQIQLKGGLRYNITPQSVRFDSVRARDQLISKVAPLIPAQSPLEAVVADVASHLQALSMKDVKVLSRQQFGVRPADPAVSVIIPVRQTLDFLPVQLVHFANDPVMQQAEIIYVLDAMEQKDTIADRLEGLHALYALPVTLLTLSHRAGQAMAINQAVLQSRAPLLLFMNECVVPRHYGWLQELINYLEAHEEAGIVAPRLIYEDDAIRQAGISFAKGREIKTDVVQPLYRGYPAGYPAACINRAVPAVSTECALVKAELFARAGQFSTDYITGEFDESDLCLKLHKLGAQSHLCATVSLDYFADSDQRAAAEDQACRRMDAALHQTRWQPLIPEVMKHYG